MDLTHPLKQLQLSGVLETLEVRNRQAIDDRWTDIEFLSRLLEDEVARRDQKQLQLRLRRATISTAKTLETFDFNFNPALNRQKVPDLATCGYIRQHHDVILCGPTGTGKSHLAQGLACAACEQGFHVLFVQTHKLLKHLNGGRTDGSFERRLNTYLRPHLLVLDDLGLHPLPPPGPSYRARHRHQLGEGVFIEHETSA